MLKFPLVLGGEVLTLLVDAEGPLEALARLLEHGLAAHRAVVRHRHVPGHEVALLLLVPGRHEKDLDGVRLKVPAEESDEVCEVCGRQMVIKSGRFGRFLACPGMREASV